ncbi:tyrosine-type recombinase/integrase [Fictibacillus barbaricus]|uniref:Site-specific recombinase XerD n=1 Tax=Fictibacillus barbaricus TaxID=182136 RepID=A0ABU1TYI6_9BACL|nr:tyrosine-type recombinase/integrase [Fictibacillus barbaricus]MDR7072230.1 site-specific recombinase XerD [Fictibacillus barbaricus]
MEEYPNLPDYAQLFIDHLQKKGRKKSTIKRYSYDLLDFFAWIRVMKKSDDLYTIQKLNKELLNEYFLFLTEQREYSAATTNRVFTVTKSLFHFLQVQKRIKESPFKDFDQKWEEDKHFKKEDFITEEEFAQLFQILSSYEGLTEKQQKFRHLLIKRNEAIVTLLYNYGLTLQELASIERKDVQFTAQLLTVKNDDEKRLLPLEKETQQLLFAYFDSIPDSIKPRNHSSDRFFIAFDYQRGTYRFDYSNYEPKPLTVIAIQKMLRQEIKRSGIRTGVSSQHLRRTAILNFIMKNNSTEEIQARFGLKSALTVQRYENYIKEIETIV